MEVEFIQDVDKTVEVLRDAGAWLLESGKEPSKWWQLKNLNTDFLFQYAAPDEFYVGMVDNQPAVAAILQVGEEAQSWQSVDGDTPQPALYIHWLCVSRQFAGSGLTSEMVSFAARLAREKQLNILRVDTNASEEKLRVLYEGLGFELAGILEEDYRTTALYQKNIV